MDTTIYSREVEIRDKNKVAFTVSMELRTMTGTHKHWETLEDVKNPVELAISATYGNGGGQCLDHIECRTETQEELVKLWKEYHLNGVCAGTKRQTEYLKTQYEADYETWNGILTSDHWLGEVMQNMALCEKYNAVMKDPVSEAKFDKLVKAMNGWGRIHEYFAKHDKNDFYVKCFVMTLEGYMIDNGYAYGSEWLYKPLSEDWEGDYEGMLDDLCDRLEDEEDEYTEQLEQVFDMADDDFEATDEIVKQVMELRDCDEEEAKHFLALGQFLECTFGDLNDTFECKDDNLYEANGMEYYVGTDDELKEIATKRVMEDGEYDEFWKQAVAEDRTTDGLDDWKQSIIDDDGWASILNTWDGNSYSQCVDGEWFEICRS